MLPLPVSIQQIKAARALLGWTQSDLATAAHLSLPAIAKLESGLSHPRSDTMDALRGAFERNGIEFLDSPGVQMRKEAFRVDVLHGRDGIYRIWHDIEVSLAGGGEILISNVDEALWASTFGDKFWEMLRRRAEMQITERVLVREGDRNIIADKGEITHRTVPPAVFSGNTPHYIYCNKMAIVQLQTPMQAILIESRPVADAFRAVFEHNWKNGGIVPPRDIIPLKPVDEVQGKPRPPSGKKPPRPGAAGH
jgi:transcriptional regulator with XRE-family HTH domain